VTSTDLTVLDPARTYQDHFGPAIFEPHSRITVGFATPQPGEIALDLACGTGILTRHVAAAAGPTGSVVGVDLNPAMVEVARSLPSPPGSAPIAYRAGDALTVDLPEGECDLVVCQQGLQFFPDRATGARRMRRAVHDRGRAVVAVWRSLEHHPLLEALEDAAMIHLRALDGAVDRDDLTAPFSFGDPEELRTCLLDAGFADVEMHERAVDTRFGDPDRFVELLQTAYAAVVPALVQDPQAFATYVARVEEDTRALVTPYRDGDHVGYPMHALIAVALV
jgi:ubiquinone/menaquinone biosynthesis C-methylase UbiE